MFEVILKGVNGHVEQVIEYLGPTSKDTSGIDDEEMNEDNAQGTEVVS